MTFLVHAPAAPLDRAVEAFYCPAGPMPYRCEDVMPGPSMDLKINFGAALDARRAGGSDWDAQSSNGWCMGLWDEHHSVRWPSHVDFIGVTFRPGGAFLLFGIEAHELGNQVVPLDALLGAFGMELRERLAGAGNAQARFALLEAVLTARLRRSRDADRIAPALRLLQRSQGMIPIAELAAASNVSHKHLVTLFNRVAGAPPKKLARLYRLQHLLTAIDRDDTRTWTSVAHDFHYFDQPHFNKDFKRFTGLTPARYGELRRRVRAADPDHAPYRRLLPQG